MYHQVIHLTLPTCRHLSTRYHHHSPSPDFNIDLLSTTHPILESIVDKLCLKQVVLSPTRTTPTTSAPRALSYYLCPSPLPQGSQEGLALPTCRLLSQPAQHFAASPATPSQPAISTFSGLWCDYFMTTMSQSIPPKPSRPTLTNI